VVAVGAGEASALRAYELTGPGLAVVPPAVAATASRSAGPADTIVCLGPLEPGKGHLEAMWAFDVLHYLYPGLRLVVAGDGPERPRLERFRRQLGMPGQVELTGPVADPGVLLATAAVVWVPSRGVAGVQAALEGMAHGVPVVASRLPGLAEVVADGETGVLVPPGDVLALARQTRLLLDDAPRRVRLGAAGRDRARAVFGPRALACRLADVYHGLAG
jgi:glycosyltransferase involved in cell wall biosynthesis